MLDQDEKLLPDNLEYSHNRFAGGCMDIIERSYILATFRVVITKKLYHKQSYEERSQDSSF